MTASRADAAPVALAGVPLSRWLFGLRVWVAMILALYVAFWLELEGASSAATCVAILALPTRGQALEKAAYRSLATVVGVAASIVISGLFSQERDLFLLAFAGWLGLCVFMAGLLDGNRAYAAVLSGYTVAIVSVMQVDRPQDVFSAGLNRGAAIVVGIACIALVNDLFAAPDAYPSVLGKVGEARSRALEFARAASRDGMADPEAAARIFAAMTALRPGIDALATESTLGSRRAAAARSTVVALAEEVTTAWAMARRGGRAMRPDLASAFGDAGVARGTRERLEARAIEASAREAPHLIHAATLVEADRLATEGLADLRAGRRPERDPRLPLFRSRRLAFNKGVRVGLAVALSSALFVVSSWSQTSVALSLLGVIAALSSTTPSPRGFARTALTTMPFAVAVAGVTEFVVLDGVDQFQLLAIALAPIVIGACLASSSPDPKLGAAGNLMLLFVPVILSPSNPQSYDPLAFLVLGVLAGTAALLLTFWLTVMAPATDARRRRWLLRAAADDLRATAGRRRRRLTCAEAAYRSADRIAQIASLGAAGDPDRSASLADALLLADLDGALRRARHAIDGALRGDGRRTAVVALRDLDVEGCLSVQADLSAGGGVDQRRAAVAVLLVADLMLANRADLRRLVPGLVVP